jgi:hypothetical protein
MAQPHEYHGDGSNNPEGTAGLSYEESYQANPFPNATPPWVPGQQNIIEVTVEHPFITDDGMPPAGKKWSLTSITANPMPHVEYGRIGAN